MKSLPKWLMAVAMVVALFVGTCFVGTPAIDAQPPRAFTYQGMLDLNGTPVPDGTYNFVFTITDPTGLPFTQTMAVPVHNGIFDVVIGSATSIPANFSFNGSVTIAAVVNGSTNVGPVAIWSAPYAVNAGTVNGLQASETPVAGELFPVPIGTGYTGTAKLDPAFLPQIPSNLLPVSSSGIGTINGIGPDSTGNFFVSGINGISITGGTNSFIVSGPPGGIPSIATGAGLQETSIGSDYTLSVAPGGISGPMIVPNLVLGSSDSGPIALTVADSEMNGNAAFSVLGGIRAGNPTGAADGTGLSPVSPQTYWADQAAVPRATGTSLQIYNRLVSTTSTIVVTAVGSAAASGGITLTAQSAGTFTVSSKNAMGTNGGGTMTFVSYIVVNH
ncbi:MAG TPA: hypothetical protein VGM92_01685 [Candidatus Kapabacteria bacterium]